MGVTIHEARIWLSQIDLMTSEVSRELVSIAVYTATRKDKAMAVFKLGDIYYIVDAREWENGRAYGKYLFTAEPKKILKSIYQ